MALVLLLGAAGCGVPGSEAVLDLGTVALRNDSDQGMAPLIVREFYVAPADLPVGATNLLTQELQPGAVVIVGLFPAGMYVAVAVLDNGTNINFPPTEVRAGEPTTFVVPAL